MRTIDADKTIGHLKTRLYESALNNATAICDVAYVFQDIAENRIETWIDEMPTVSQHVESVGEDGSALKHEHWIDRTTDIECSRCGKGMDKWDIYHATGVNKPNYCPMCGAVMDEEVRT